MDHTESHSVSEPGATASRISREIVQLHAKLYGRGPTKAKTYLHDDYALCLLENVFTPAENTLIGAGRGDHVQATRMAFQEAVRERFVELVETATGRQVRAFLSMVHLDVDLSVELFLFARDAESGAFDASSDGFHATSDGDGTGPHANSDGDGAGPSG
jgi:uncharacterized protein YbcI